MSKEVVHVHDLAPSLPVTNLSLVLQMGDHLGLAGKRPNETASVRCRILLGRAESDVGLMDVRGRFIHDVHQQFDESVSDDIIVAVIAQLESVVEKNVRFVFVIIRIDNLKVDGEK